jgi:hypothetical protein
MTKRNPLDRLINTNNTVGASPAPSTLDLIPTARQVKRDARSEQQIEKRKASRKAFDKRYPNFGYFIPEHLHMEAKALRATILGLAQNKEKNLNVTEISMTTSLVVWALAQVRTGKLIITGTPNSRRKMTVIIEDVTDTWEKTPVEIKPVEKKMPVKRMTIAYRFPPDVEKQIRELTGDALPKGEVLVRLLQHAVQAVQNGDTKINIAPMEMRQVASIVDLKKAGDSWA